MPETQIVLIDGRSGAGKTDLADRLASIWECPVVHLDDVYPGWDGLRAGRDAVIRDVVIPMANGGDGSYRRWDWGLGAPAETVIVPSVPLIIIEGCGILSPLSAEYADVALWVECADEIRRERAVRRDGHATAENFVRWALQEDDVIATDFPMALADEILRTDDEE
ncbi:MAG: hypothetical protein ACKOWP_01725 [Microbacteriaceae bacterium]